MGFSPLDDELELCGGWSEGVSKLSFWLSGHVDFRTVEEILGRVGTMQMSTSSVWRCTERWGNRLMAIEQKQRTKANAVPQHDEIIPGETGNDRRMGVAIDGWNVNIRDEGWKEVKAGSIFNVKMRSVRDQRTNETVELAHAVDNTYVAHLGGPEIFGEKIWSEAYDRDLHNADEEVCLGDGARWIWNLCQDHFPQTEQIVDWYHAKQHLWAAANLIHGEDSAAVTRWMNIQEERLYQGHAARIVDDLDDLAKKSPKIAEGISSQATYFRNNQRRMQYLQYREDLWPIGSGMIESGCKQFQMRMKGPGMIWSRPGGERMLSLRATILSNRFDQQWETLQNSPGF